MNQRLILQSNIFPYNNQATKDFLPFFSSSLALNIWARAVGRKDADMAKKKDI